MIILKFICVIILVISVLLYLNNIIVDIGSAISASRNFNEMYDDQQKAKTFAKFRMILSFIIGITLAIVICF